MTSNQTVSLRQKYIYAVCVWTVLTLLFPLWKGVSYNQERAYDQTGRRVQPVWREGGVFGITGFHGRLHGFSPFVSRAPLFFPPNASGGMSATLRMPLMTVTARHHIELHTGWLMWQWCIGLMIAGLIVNTIGDRDLVRSDLILNIAQVTGKTLLVVNVPIIGIALLGGGLLLGIIGREGVSIILAIGLASGLAVGFLRHRKG